MIWQGAFEFYMKIKKIENMDSLHSLVMNPLHALVCVMNPLHALVCVMNPLHTLVSVMNFTICSFSESVYSKLLQMNIITVCYPRE